MDIKDALKILGIKQKNNLTEDEVRKAFIAAAEISHPDKHKGDEATYTKIMADVNEARNVLLDDLRKNTKIANFSRGDRSPKGSSEIGPVRGFGGSGDVEDKESDDSEGIIEGIVSDSETKKGIKGAEVKIRNWPTATTDKEGTFKINIQGTGYLRVVATKDGYASGGATTKYIQKRTDSDFVEIELKRKDKKRVKLPKIGKPVPISNFIGLLIALLVGIIISAILGSMFLFFGFLCLAVHFLLPSAADTETFRYAMILAKKDAYRKIKEIRNDSRLSDEEKERRIANLVKQVKDATAAEAIVAKTPALKWAISPVAILKHLLKALGIALFIWGLASLTLPFAKLIALVAAFIGYFYIGGTKEPEEEK